MPRSKYNQNVVAESNGKVSMEPILQDFSITSQSEIDTGVLPPSDSSLNERLGNYEVIQPNITLNQTEDMELHFEHYPPDTTMVDITKIVSEQPKFKKPFTRQSKKKPNTSLFDKDVLDSENDTPKSKINRPFKRENKVSRNSKLFENAFNSSLDNSQTVYSNTAKNLITKRKMRVKNMRKHIENSLFVGDLNTSESDVFSLFVDQSSRYSADSVYIDIHPSQNKSTRAPRRKRMLFKQPEPLSKTQIQEIIDKFPFSELKRKKRRSSFKPKEQGVPDPSKIVVREPRKPRVISVSLKKPKKWVTKHMYAFIINKLKPRFGILARVQAEEVILSLVEYVKRIMNEKDNFYQKVEEMKLKLANFGIIQTHLDFHDLVRIYFDGQFSDKLFPAKVGVDWNPFEPNNLLENIVSD